MQTLSLDFAADDTVTGFRLQRLEVFNWGTFNRHVWTIGPSGHNALLTGDIGSGKSTLVDALTTLLVPHHRIVYNKAAGAESKERTLYSYIRGEYKSAKDDLTQAAKAVALRDQNSYTVLLGHFHNQGFSQSVTLAQVFWLKDQKRNPERFFVVSQTPLSIAEHFSGFGSDILDLKKRLRRTAQVEVLDNFKEYGTRFRHLFGIQNEQALELFYQTVSMKSVGNLTDFVRNHMLEKGDVDSRIENLRRNFENLNRAHEAVLKAKDQIEQLTPVAEDGRRYQDLSASIEELRRCREALVAYFAHHKAGLLETQIQKLEVETQKIAHLMESLREEIGQLRRQESELKTSIDESGGRRLQMLEQEIAAQEKERDKKQLREKEYRSHGEKLELPQVHSEEDFYRNLTEARAILKGIEERIEEIKKAEIDRSVELQELQKEHLLHEKELDSLRRRKSNIPLKNLEIRREMANILGVDEEELPFAGELLQVDGEASEWQGAIERLLHNFGLSLLVPEHLYAQVSHYVDRTHLRGRLVYFRVREADARRVGRSPEPDSLVRKVRIKPDSSFYPWLEAQLRERFDYICCDDLDRFRRLPRTITRSGQIKSGGQRHEKDDRRSIHDRSHYILGWSNEEKIRALEAKKRELEAQAQRVADCLADLGKQQQDQRGRRDAVRDLLKFEDYGDIHWAPLARRIQTLQEEKTEIERSSDMLQALHNQLLLTQQELELKEKRQGDLGKEAGKLEERLESRRLDLAEAQQLTALLMAEERQVWFPKIDPFCRQTLNLQNIEKAQREVRETIQNRLDNGEGKTKRLTEKLVGRMQAYKNAYPAETSEVDANLEALGEYAAMLQTLQEQDLPRHEARFKQLLNEGTINSVALFQNQLDKERQLIRDKIETINNSLQEIEYNPGTYIELVMDKTQDAEVREFQQDLKQCLAHTLEDSEIYNEAKFLQVKAIIDRFNGREGLVDLDRKWTRKVTDVRNWFNFSASERWQEDGSEREFYSDTSGKSGGQKEKLAYTILASALAYQFGLEWGAVQSRSFRFVVIDEAFGKGSDESTRYGLELFKKLHLQLLIVTPLQKIHIIEDYIRSVHYVHNEGGSNSVLRNLTLEEYQTEKEKFQRLAEV
jgi:uncharacterized protein YPO0396